MRRIVTDKAGGARISVFDTSLEETIDLQQSVLGILNSLVMNHLRVASHGCSILEDVCVIAR